jgi:hypothetical protein
VVSWRVLRGRRSVSLLTALAASAALLIAPFGNHGPPPPLQTVTEVWPNAKHATLIATLADGTFYQPLIFTSATTSVGAASSKDNKFLRLLILAADGKTREIRRLPADHDPSFPAAVLSGTTLVWAESTTRGHVEIWAADLRGGAAHQLTADAGDARFYQSQYDLVVGQGRVHWVAAGPDGTTEVRSVALSGGPSDVRVEQGTWAFTDWPWLSNGVVSSAGATTLRNALTGRDVALPTAPRGVTACTPTWCQLVSLGKDGNSKIELMHPDGSERRTVAVGDPNAGGGGNAGDAETVIADVALLNRFEVFARLTATSELTGNVQVMLYEISTRHTVEISPDAFAVSFRAGILSWSTGTQQSFLRHALDLRTL